MADAKTSSSHESLRKPCNCYRVSSLAKPILDTDQTLNLKDMYVLGEQLGWGQFGVIRECTDKMTGEALACKSIAKDRLVTLDDARSVKLEIEIMTRLSGHPNVVDLKAVFEDEDYVHLVMELCAGGELFHQLEKHGRFSEVEARVVFRQLMEVVLHCHETGVVHRDLKPENILLATKSSYSQIKLADFGLATYIKPGESLKGTVGSPFYIAPEVLAGGYNQSADVWSAGVILYILLSGTPPFWGKTKSRIFDAVREADLRFPSDHWDCITEPAKELVRGMLCTDPSQRLTAQQVLDYSWMKDEGSDPLDCSQFGNQSCREWDFGGTSFSAFMGRDQDISFVMGSPTTCNVSSPTLIRGSSLSPFPGESSGCLASGRFSFCSDDSPCALEISPPILSMPSFAFFSPGTGTEESSCAQDLSSKITCVNGIRGEGNTEEMLMLTKSSLCCGNDAGEMEHRRTEVKRTGGTIGSRILGMLSKRNRTIGLGEREQLDLMVTESVIRWASCTHLPTAPSLRSSLVC